MAAIGPRGLILAALLGAVGLLGAAAALAGPAGAVTLPDQRVWELATRYEKDGHEADLNGVLPSYGVASRDGDALEWSAVGGCCGATSAAQETYRSSRATGGWQTQAVTPPWQGDEREAFSMGGPRAEFWTADMQRFVFAVPKLFAPGAEHQTAQSDIYAREPDGKFTLVSTGPLATGEEPFGSVFGGATRDAGHVAFTSAESFTADATGLNRQVPFAQYLYLRDLTAGITSLVDVDNSGNLLGTKGAVLGDAGHLDIELMPADTTGTSTNAISNDGSKAFFEVPPPSPDLLHNSYLEEGRSHLYMRDLADSTTTALDDPSSAGWARYEGAAEDGSLVFFTSNEGLDGAPAVPELYVFNTTGAAIGPVPSMSSIAISLGDAGVAPVPAGPVEGVTAIANDGSRVWFIAEDVLAANPNPVGSEAVEGEPNLYMHDLGNGATTYVATLSPADISDCQPNCAEGLPVDLRGEPDVSRRAFPTPDGSALVFESAADLTGEDGVLQTSLTAPVVAGDHNIQVESTAGLQAGQWILVGLGTRAERERIESIDSPTELTVNLFDEHNNFGFVDEFAAGDPVRRLDYQDYRFLADGSLTCISCVGGGAIPVGSSTLGVTGGGTYAPPGQNVPMNEDATQIFFQSPNALTPEAQPAGAGRESEATNVYEWENGHRYLISDGSQAGALLDGTTPSGDDVFFTTQAQMPGTDNGSWINVYDARVGGGFPGPATEAAPCVGQACRGAGGSTPLFEVPASSIGATEEVVAEGGGSFRVAPLSARQRRRLARTGKLTLKVSANSPGTLTATLQATLTGRSAEVAKATTTLTEAGAAKLDLSLSRAARERLAASGSLALRLEVTFSAGNTPATVRLKLRAPDAKGRAKHG